MPWCYQRVAGFGFSGHKNIVWLINILSETKTPPYNAFWMFQCTFLATKQGCSYWVESFECSNAFCGFQIQVTGIFSKMQ